MKKTNNISILREAEKFSVDEMQFRIFIKSVVDILWPLREIENKYKLHFSGEEIVKLSNSILSSINLKSSEDFSPIIESVLETKHEISYGLVKELLDPANVGGAEIKSIHESLKKIKFPIPHLEMILQPIVERSISDKLDSFDASDAPIENDGGQPEWGKFLFAPQRKGEVPKEPNTKEEEIAYLELEDHVLENQPLSPETIENLKKAIKSGSYKKILHEPDADQVYRGIKITKSGLEKLLQDKNLPDKGSIIFNKTVAGRGDEGGIASSWSIEPNVAEGFADFVKDQNPDYYSLVFVAKVKENPNNFVTGPDGIYKLSKLSQYVGEDEVIALGPVRVHKIYWDVSGRIKIDESLKRSHEKDLRALIREILQNELISRICIEDKI